MNQPIKYIPIFLVVSAFFLITSCTVVKKYNPNQPFIFENNINIKGNLGRDKKLEMKDALEGQIEDSAKPRVKDIVFLIHSIKSPPTYDTVEIVQSTINMRNYLLGKGYRSSLITYDTSLKIVQKQQRVTVNYTVDPGKLYTIDSIAFDLNDTTLQQIAMELSSNSLLKKGEPFDYSIVDQERARLVDAFHNRGYYKITLDDIYALADSSYSELLDPTLDPFQYIERLAEVEKKKETPTIDIFIRQRPLADSARTQKYNIGNFTVYSDAPSDVSLPTEDTTQTLVENVKVVSVSNTFDPKFIVTNIELKPGTLYTEKNYSKTLNNFNRLGAWQNINIFSAAVDSTKTINYLLKLTPAKKQFFSVDFEGSSLLNYSTQISQVGSGKIGLAFNFTLRNRNIGRKAIQLENSLRTGIEFNDFKQILTGQISLSNRLVIPWLMTPFKVKNEKNFQNARTIIAADLSYLDRFEFYRVNSANTFIAYEWKPKPNVTWQLKPLNIEASFVKQDSGFKEAIADFPLLIYSYNDGLVIGMNGSYSVSFNSPLSKRVSTLRLYAEESGMILGGLFPSITDTSKLLSNLFRFIKLDADFRHYIQFKKSTLVFRAFAGYGIAFETDSKKGEVTLPFFKSYFAGGPNSLRGWQIRKIGIGQNIYFDTVQNGEFNDKYADVQIEANAEYRFNLFPVYGIWLRGAVFTDIGNIWYRNELDGQFPKSNFIFGRVLEDLAISAGYGLRVDFKYFVLRFDLGYPLKDPRYGPDKSDQGPIKFYTPKKGGWFVQDHWNKGTFQFAIGYPF